MLPVSRNQYSHHRSTMWMAIHQSRTPTNFLFVLGRQNLDTNMLVFLVNISRPCTSRSPRCLRLDMVTPPHPPPPLSLPLTPTHPLPLTASTYPVNVYYQHTLLTSPVNSSFQHHLLTHLFNTPYEIFCQDTLSIHPLNASYTFCLF